MAVYQLVCGAVTVYTGKKSFNLIRKLIITDLTIVGERNKNSFRHKKVDFIILLENKAIFIIGSFLFDERAKFG